jgi:hypothetical protein
MIFQLTIRRGLAAQYLFMAGLYICYLRRQSTDLPPDSSTESEERRQSSDDAVADGGKVSSYSFEITECSLGVLRTDDRSATSLEG